jgi:hypothetical protein
MFKFSRRVKPLPGPHPVKLDNIVSLNWLMVWFSAHHPQQSLNRPLMAERVKK